MNSISSEYDGGCTCGQVRFRLQSAPMFVHCCHCRWCQRETGSAFALNAMIEADRVQLLEGKTELIPLPTQSGRGQTVARCPACQVAVWSHYDGLGKRVSFVKVGALDKPDRVPPDVHIYTDSKQPWVVIPDGVAAYTGYYKRSELWPADSQARFKAVLAANKNS